MSNKMKKILIISIFAVICSMLTSCYYEEMSRFYVANKTDSEITDFEIYWTSEDNEDESIIISKIPAKKESDIYAAFLQETFLDDADDIRIPFSLSYIKDEVKYTVENSATRVEDKEGNIYDPEAYFVPDELYVIEITDDGYRIKLEN